MHHSVLALHGRQSTSIATCAAGIAYLLLGPYSGFGCNGLQEEGVCEVDPSRLITTATKIMHSDLAPREVNLLTGLVVRVFFSLSTTFPYQRLLVRQITPVKWLCVGEVFTCSTCHWLASLFQRHSQKESSCTSLSCQYDESCAVPRQKNLGTALAAGQCKDSEEV